MISVVFAFSSLFITIYVSMFYFESGRFLPFSASDSVKYDYVADYIAQGPVKDSLSNFPDDIKKLKDDDKGFIVYASMLYRIMPSNLSLIFCNLFLNIATTIFIYRLGRRILSKMGAFVSALMFGLATYTIFFQVSGLKETLMVFLTVGSFFCFLRGFEKGSSISFFVALLLCLSLMFFRVPLAFFVLISVICCYFIKKSMSSVSGIAILTILILTGVFFYLQFGEYMDRYMRAFSRVLRIKGDEFGGDIYFGGTVAVFSGLFGPFPTIIPFEGKENISIYAGSLVLKVLISAYFFVGTYFAYREKNSIVIGLAIFCLLEIGGLSYLMETLEFRKGFPHMAFFILVALYGFERIEIGRSKKCSVARIFVKITNGALAGVILCWNILRFY